MFRYVRGRGSGLNVWVVLIYSFGFFFFFFYHLVSYLSTTADPQRAFYGVRMLRAAQLKRLLSGQSVWGERLGVETLWSRPLRYIIHGTTMSKPKFQTEWEEIDEEYQQLQVTEKQPKRAYYLC